MSSLLRRHPSPAAVPPLEDDNFLSEILLSLHPQPSSLPRASLVCKRWRGLVSHAGFCRRFRRNPPLLCFFQVDNGLSFVPSLKAPDRVSPERFSLQLKDRGDSFVPLGCRHGLVLIFLWKRLQLLVWDPVPGGQHRIGAPPPPPPPPACCAGWGSLYWLLGGGPDGIVILEFDMDRQRLSVIPMPVNDLRFLQLSLIRADGGGIGLLILSGFGAQFWKTRTNSEEMGTQMLLEFAEDNNAVLLWTIDGLVMLQLESLQFEKVLGTNIIAYYHSFESVCTAETGIGGGHDGADLLHNT
ncbi:hypothetical protein VPH35_108778 [Triticum aestivum]